MNTKGRKNNQLNKNQKNKNNQLNKNQKNKNNHPFKAMIEVKFAF